MQIKRKEGQAAGERQEVGDTAARVHEAPRSSVHQRPRYLPTILVTFREGATISKPRNPCLHFTAAEEL